MLQNSDLIWPQISSFEQLKMINTVQHVSYLAYGVEL